MKTDSIFYRLFQEFPSIFFKLLGNPSEEASLYQFSSIEIKQTAFRIDGVFLPKQEAFEEGIQQGIEQGKLKAVRPMLTAGLTVEYIAQALDLSIEEVRQAAQ